MQFTHLFNNDCSCQQCSKRESINRDFNALIAAEDVKNESKNIQIQWKIDDSVQEREWWNQILVKYTRQIIIETANTNKLFMKMTWIYGLEPTYHV